MATQTPEAMLGRLQSVAQVRAEETGRAKPDESDLDHIAAQAQPHEREAWGTPAGFRKIKAGMRLGASERRAGRIPGTSEESAVAKKKTGTTGSKSKGKKPGRLRRAAAAVAAVPAAVVAAVTGKKRKAPKRKGAPRRKAGRRALPPFIAAAGATPGSMVLLDAAQGADGVWSVPSRQPAKRGGKGRKGGGGGGGFMAKRERFGDRALAVARGKGTEMFLLGGTGILGAAGGFYLQKMEPLTVPNFGWKVRKGSLAALVAFGLAVAFRKRRPKFARYAGVAAAGLAGGAAAEVVQLRLDARMPSA